MLLRIVAVCTGLMPCTLGIKPLADTSAEQQGQRKNNR